MAVDSDRVEGQFMRSTENPNGDFSTVGNQNFLQLHDGAACPQPVVDRVPVFMVLMLLIKLVVEDGLRLAGRSVNGEIHGWQQALSGRIG